MNSRQQSIARKLYIYIVGITGWAILTFMVWWAFVYSDGIYLIKANFNFSFEIIIEIFFFTILLTVLIIFVVLELRKE